MTQLQEKRTPQRQNRQTCGQADDAMREIGPPGDEDDAAGGAAVVVIMPKPPEPHKCISGGKKGYGGGYF